MVAPLNLPPLGGQEGETGGYTEIKWALRLGEHYKGDMTGMPVYFRLLCLIIIVAQSSAHLKNFFCYSGRKRIHGRQIVVVKIICHGLAGNAAPVHVQAITQTRITQQCLFDALIGKSQDEGQGGIVEGER